MTVINTNTAATLTANALTKNERAMSQAMERLSTGVRINSASDDAAGLAISSRMTSQINGLNQAVRNANDATSMVQTADGALIEVTSMLQRMREIAVQGASGTNTGTNDMAALNTEYEALRDEVFQIVDDTQWNGATLLDGNVAAAGDQTVDFHVGANASQTVTIDFGDFETGSFGTFTAAHDIDAATEANTAIGIIDTALTTVNSKRAVFGAAINRLEHTADNLANVSQNTSASRSRILDADYASETTELARTQIIQQAGTAMLSQANQQAQSVLALLK
jgi:flagellin